MQLRNFTKYSKALLLLFALCNGAIGYTQTNTGSSLNDWFDNIVGKENLGINNGSLHISTYTTFDKGNHNYYTTSEFSNGDIVYDDQFYKNVNLKYDTYKDALVIKPYGEYNYMGLNLILEKTKSFTLKGKTFVNLSFNKSSIPEFIKGFYEENLIGKKVSLYIKYYKTRKKIIKYETVYDEFKEDNEFIINYRDVYYKITSREDVIKVFPKLKNNIKDYYLMNEKTEKMNKKLFMEDLAKTINIILLNESN